MNKTALLFLLVLGCISSNTHAQTGMSAWGENIPQTSKAQLFRLNPEQYNHHFDFALPEEGSLQVDFLRLSDWGNENGLLEVAAMAADRVRQLADSFRKEYTVKTMALNIPIDGKVIALQYREHDDGKRQMAYKDGAYYQLKTGFDTIRVVRNIGIRKKPLADSGLIQVQYTFILKDLKQIYDIAQNPAILESAGHSADSAIARQRERWPNQDAWHHTLRLQYNPSATQTLIADNNAGSLLSFLQKRIKIYLGIGVAVYTASNNNNAVSPYLDETLAYMFRSRGKMQPFAGFNLTGFGLVNTNGRRESYTSYNLEYGLCKKAPGFMQQKTSVSLGYMTKYRSSGGGDPVSMFHMGFTFGFSPVFSGGLSFATDFKKDSKQSLLVVNFKFNL